MPSKKTGLWRGSRGFEGTAEKPLTDWKPTVDEL